MLQLKELQTAGFQQYASWKADENGRPFLCGKVPEVSGVYAFVDVAAVCYVGVMGQMGFLLTGANVHDSTPFEPLIDAVPPIPGQRGRPRRRPDKLHADKAYDHRRCRDACRRRKIRPRIARRGIDTSQKLGRHRWVIERTFAWFNKLRRLTIRRERRIDIHHAFTPIACSLICLNALLGRF